MFVSSPVARPMAPPKDSGVDGGSTASESRLAAAETKFAAPVATRLIDRPRLHGQLAAGLVTVQQPEAGAVLSRRPAAPGRARLR